MWIAVRLTLVSAAVLAATAVETPAPGPRPTTGGAAPTPSPTSNVDVLLKTWVYSHKEADGATVYRPEGYALPRARGRTGLEFRRDGTVVQYAIGRGDAWRPTLGRWTRPSERDLRLSFPDGEEGKTLNVLEVGPDILKVKPE